MAIATRDQLLAALAGNHTRAIIDKASLSNAVAAQLFSLWTATGVPSNGAAPTTAAVCTSALTGAVSFPNQTAPASSYLGWATLATGNANQGIEIHDRLAHMGGLSGTVTTAQGALSLVTTNPGADRIGDANYSDVQWFLEIYTALGATGVNATVNVTYNDDSTGNLTAVALGATPRAGRLYPLLSASVGRWIKAVNSVTLSATTGTAGNFGITASRCRTVMASDLASKPVIATWAQLNLPEFYNDACIWLVMPCTTTTTGTVKQYAKIVHG